MTHHEKFKIFIARPDLPKSALDLLRSYDLEIWDKADPVPKPIFLKKIANKDALLIHTANIIDEEALNAAGQNLKVIGTVSAGYDHIDINEVKKRGIKVGNTAVVVNDSVADLAVALILIITRRINEAHNMLVAGKWKAIPNWDWMSGYGIINSTIGIFGLGRIGTEIAKRVVGFKPGKILYTSRTEKHAASELKAEKVSLEDLLKQSDIIVVCVSLNKETKQILNAEKLNLMKRTAFIVNVARGQIIDQLALVKALKEKRIAGAALDVTYPEPLPKGHDLLKMDNCYVLPHLGTCEFSTRVAMAELTARNIIAGLHEMPLPSEVT